MIQNLNVIPPGKVCPPVGGKRVVAVINASIDDEGRVFNVVLEDGNKARVPEADLLDEPKKEGE